MPLLKKEPLETVRSLPALFALAFALEEEAATRYRDLALKMRTHGVQDTAAVFDHLAEEERGHRDHVSQLSRNRTGMAPGAADVSWDLSETFDDETERDLAGSQIATPYRALSMAVRNEERAFAFWSYVAAHAQDAAVRDAAEAMAREELEHVSLLRRERRRAYHAHRASIGQAVPRSVPGQDILATASDLERHLASQLGALPTASDKDRRVIEEMATESLSLAGETQGLATDRKRIEAGASPHPLKPTQTAEMLVERYLEAADHAKDDTTLARAQSLAGKAITRLAALRAIKDEEARARK